ncbi:protein of unknown function [Nitrospina watsonii]|uniref:Uncharacterized protein n=1 Tax=Nitrospina watsonii TaxID=1323948 RepID=A0ABM9HH38_9BACT|nr:protein of unknown function [Nitrospina watsonii]
MCLNGNRVPLLPESGSFPSTFILRRLVASTTAHLN